MEISCSRGDEIILKDSSCQIFEGTVKNVNKKLGRVLLSNIIQHPDKKEIEGFRHFDKNEILEIRQKKSFKSVKESIYEGSSVNSSVNSSELNGGVFTKNTEYIYIKNFDHDFDSAVKLLKQSKIIGLCLEDKSKGRSERAVVLALSTLSNSFIFDLKILGDEAFSNGLREILESSDIVKIVHDCRLLSDCLKHKHLVNLENVRDVEAEDIMLVYQQRKMIRRHSRSLDYLIKIYMNVDIEMINVSFEAWNERPLPSSLLNSLACLTSYLIPLQSQIEKKYLQQLIDASNMYNKFVRESDLFEFVYTDLKHTLREKMIEIVKHEINPRNDSYKAKKVT